MNLNSLFADYYAGPIPERLLVTPEMYVVLKEEMVKRSRSAGDYSEIGISRFLGLPIVVSQYLNVPYRFTYDARKQ